jgi:hypothetical protein
MTFFNAEIEAADDEQGNVIGDARRCPTHGTVTSSPDGMFDGLCGACEYDADFDYDGDSFNSDEAIIEDAREVAAYTFNDGDDVGF